MMGNKSEHYKSNKTIEQKNQEMKDIIETLENGVKEVFDSDKYKNYLKMCGKFHQYSFNNILLILSQCPKAQVCSSYAKWRSMKMPVKKGEKGIKILCPITYSYKKKNSSNNDGNTEDDTLVVQGVRFKIGHVFDVSQVEGELPTLVNELIDDPEYLKTLTDEFISNSAVKVAFDSSLKKGGANGYYDLNTKSISIRDDMSSMQTFKTLIHETAHSILHDNRNVKYSRGEAEVQAESTAFVVCSALGLNTSEYSFGYIASWSSGKDLKELKDSISIIEKTSKEILECINIISNMKLTA